MSETLNCKSVARAELGPPVKRSGGELLWQDFFLQLTRGFIEEFSLAMNRNAWVLYMALGTFYNSKQRRAFPKPEHLDAVVPLARYGRSRALGKLVELGLVEIWGERKGRRRRTFYRLLHVNEKRRHCAKKQQLDWREIEEMKNHGQLPKDYAWATAAYLKRGK